MTQKQHAEKLAQLRARQANLTMDGNQNSDALKAARKSEAEARHWVEERGIGSYRGQLAEARVTRERLEGEAQRIETQSKGVTSQLDELERPLWVPENLRMPHNLTQEQVATLRQEMLDGRDEKQVREIAARMEKSNRLAALGGTPRENTPRPETYQEKTARELAGTHNLTPEEQERVLQFIQKGKTFESARAFAEGLEESRKESEELDAVVNGTSK